MVSGRLRELIESGEFDWDDLNHRVMYLRAWARGEFSRHREEFSGAR
jgi:hypothetical protein